MASLEAAIMQPKWLRAGTLKRSGSYRVSWRKLQSVLEESGAGDLEERLST